MSKNNLLIIGNGFDLTCKLKSSYSDYFTSKFTSDFCQSLEEVKKEFENLYSLQFEKKEKLSYVYQQESSSFTPKEINLWDLIIYYGKESLPEKWSDVETRILEFLNYDPKIDFNDLNIPNFKQMQGFVYEGQESQLNFRYYNSYFYSQLIIFAAAKFNLPDPSDSKEVLLSELNRFEENFTKYLMGLLYREIATLFHINASSLLKAVIDQANTTSTKSVTYSVLSFNYTSPAPSPEVSDLIFKWQNIHGRLKERNIIFGIDQDKVKVEDVSYQFTKTYRQLLQENDDQKNDKTVLPQKDNIEKIIFYGHSLSEADYSYFQSIFDFYDLYGSQVELFFFYNIYKSDKNNSIQQNQVLSVSKLVKKYGQTMGNKNHGENLLHKLIIEKRLTIKSLKVPEMLEY